MFRKLFLASFLTVLFSFGIFGFSQGANAQSTVAIILDAPAIYADNEKLQKTVPSFAQKNFPAPKFAVLPFEEAQTQVKIYREENNLVALQQDIDYQAADQSRIPLKQKDLLALGKSLHADYILLLVLSNTPPRMASGFFDVSYKTTITVDIRLFDVKTNKYIYLKQIRKDGKSTAILGGLPSFNNAYNNAVEKALKEIVIDTSNIQ